MAMSLEVRLTKTVVDRAEPQTKRYVIWDSETKGFGVRIGSGGRKTFIVKYRVEGGGRRAPQRFYSIGQFGSLTVDLARKRAKEVLALALTGKDPASERNAKRKEMRMSELVDLYEKEGCFIQRGKRQGEPMKPLSKKYTIARLRHHVVPLLGTKRVSGVGAPEIERFFRDVENGKTRKNEKVGPRTRIIVKGGSGAARKVFRDLSAVFSFAKRYGILEGNPCEKAVVKKTDNARTRFLSLDELRRFGTACNELEAEGVNPKAINIARLWALTGCRRQEIVELKWTELDFDNGLLLLADTKTGQSTRPLALAAIALLRSIERSDISEYVFPADFGDGFFQGTKDIWPKITKRAELPGVTPHTLRHTVGATATSYGEALALTGAMLGHGSLRSTMIYAHVDRDPSIKAANRVSDRIAAAMSLTNEGPAGDNPLPAANDSRIASNGLLPAAEWDMLLDLEEVAADDPGYLSTDGDSALNRLARRGFAEVVETISGGFAWWKITPAGFGLLRLAKTQKVAA